MTPEARLFALVREADRLLARQHARSGLMPASTTAGVHGDYRHAWVRDNLYTILGPWAAGRALRRERKSPARFDAAARKVMRGLLAAMMGQAEKVERFIVTGAPLDALHAKFDAATGAPVCADGAWGHLQLDATGLFLLFLAQFETAGLRVVENGEEARFIQRLLIYAGRAWKTPDFGIWERGHKLNRGEPELNASSIGMCKAALEALHGMTMGGMTLAAGERDIERLEAALEALLPAESASKSTDAALLSITGFPAFAVKNAALRQATNARIESALSGPHGYRRFPEDGHQSPLEDLGRSHYEPEELENFRGIECEWPLFLTFRLVTESLYGNRREASRIAARIDALAIERDGARLLPELYAVPAGRVDAERARPGSQPRIPNANLPLYWAQGLWLAGSLLHEELIAPEDIDPLKRYLAATV